MSRPVVRPASLEALQFSEVLSLVAALAATDIGRKRVAALQPVLGDALSVRRKQLEEFESAAQEDPIVQHLEEPVEEMLVELEGQRPDLGGRKLLEWARVLAAARVAVERVDRSETAETLQELTLDLPDLGHLERRILDTLDERGDVRDDATPGLSRLRKRIASARRKAYGALNEALRSHGDAFSEETIPLHNGRLVLMLRAGERGRVDGLVHGSSGTGRSVYFEPMSVVEGNNALQEAVAEEEIERRRILRELGDSLLEERASVRRWMEMMARLDALQAAWRFGKMVEGRLAELSDTGLELHQARHPLLTPQTSELRERVFGDRGHRGDVTPLDLALEGEARVLVVTGPNAGGKTVSLKTVGLLVLLTLCGLPVPAAAGSRIPEVSHLVAVVGDEQDLMRDRSTFSGRLLRLQEAWEAAGPDALVLVDELGSGTDPEEGTALAVALVERLASEGATALITTHLVGLASVALELDHTDCAAMEFDRDSGRPTFRLLPGPPGGSEAIALARLLGLPDAWLERAESLVSEEHGQLTRLLAEVEATRAELEEETLNARKLRNEASVERQAAAAEREALQQEKRRLATRVRREVEDFRSRVRKRVDAEIAQAREELEAGRRRGLAGEAVDRLFTEAPSVELEAEGAPAELEVGISVRHADQGWEGTLEKLSGDSAEVSVHGKRVRCSVGKLRPAGSGGVAKKQRPRVQVSHGDHEVATELNLVGRRVEPALEEMDRYLDHALLVPKSEVRIVHGHGSGRLRRAVREHLQEHPAVASIRAGRANEGGDGATVVRLRS